MAQDERNVKSLCGQCHACCGLIFHVKDGRIVSVKGDPDHPGSRGYICPKGANIAQMVYAPDRILQPLRKTDTGFKPVSWDEALDLVANRLSELKVKYGGETLIRCADAPMTEMSRDAFMQFNASFGSPNITSSGHLCHQPRKLAFSTVYGDMSQPDYRHTKLLIVWGANPSESRRYADSEVGDGTYGKNDRVIPELQRRGVKVIVIDPRRIDIAGSADKFLQILPGTDNALVLAMLNVIIGEGLYDREFVSKWTVGFDQLVPHIKQYTPEWASAITQIPAADIRELARTYATTKPAAIREGNFIDQYISCVQTTRAIGILEAITGNLDVEGGNVFFPLAKLQPALVKPPKVDRLSKQAYPMFPRVPFPAFVDAALTGKPYSPKAMIVYHGNPALINADAASVRKALQTLEFLVVCDVFMTATAQMADVILPESTQFERNGFQRYSMAEGGLVAVHRKVIEPVGQTRSGIEIEYDLAKRMGLEKDFNWTNIEGWIDHRLKPSGITFKNLEEKNYIYTTGPIEYRKYLKHGFEMPSKKVEIFSQKLRDLGFPALPVYEPADTGLPPAEVKEFPLIATTRRPGLYTHTRFRNVPALRKLEPDACVRINPVDAQANKIGDGDRTLITAALGSITMKAKVTDEAAPGVVIADFGWGNPGDGGENVNVLTNNFQRDPVSCTTPNRRFRCRIAKA
jgi:anaerobic selenocysteine-containing dehydrogenase